jgi:hypothetical protein
VKSLDDMLSALNRDEIAKQIEEGEKQIEELTAKVAKARRVLKILDGEPERAPRQARAPKAAPAKRVEFQTIQGAAPISDTKQKIADCLRKSGGPMKVAVISRATAVDYGTVYSALQANDALFRKTPEGEWTIR